jgi:type VI protein secretion system component Hcp
MSIWIEFGSPVGQWSEAASMSLGMATRPAAGGPERKAQPNDVSITRDTDDLSSKLWLHTAKGTLLARVTIEFYKGASDILYLTYSLKDVLITSMSGHSAGFRPMESLTLSAGSISWQYFKSDG